MADKNQYRHDRTRQSLAGQHTTSTPLCARRRGRQRARASHPNLASAARPCRSRRKRHASALVASRTESRLESRDIDIALQPWQPGGGTAGDYAALQCRVYNQFGVLRAKRASDTSMASCSHLITARGSDGALLGGLRIHLRQLGRLPVEVALGRCRELGDMLDVLGNTVELSGTVVRPDMRKSGLAAVIVRAAVAAIPLLQISSAVGFGHQHVLPLYASFGFVPQRSLGCYRYPDPRYRSRVAVLNDAVELGHIKPRERERILALRRRLAAAVVAARPEVQGGAL